MSRRIIDYKTINLKTNTYGEFITIGIYYKNKSKFVSKKYIKKIYKKTKFRDNILNMLKYYKSIKNLKPIDMCYLYFVSETMASDIKDSKVIKRCFDLRFGGVR